MDALTRRRPTHGSRMMRWLAATVAATGLVVVGTTAAAAPSQSHDPDVRVVASFDADTGELPEGVALDRDGTAYVSLGPPFFVGGGFGQVRSIDPQGRERILATFPDGPAPAGIAVDRNRTVFAAVPDPGGPDVGILRITRSGEVSRVDGTEAMAVPNGLAFSPRGTLYATDSVLGQVWSLDRGAGTATPWLTHELLAGCAPGQFGANGISVRKRWMVVANTSRGAVVKVRVRADGSPGRVLLVAGDADCDEADRLWGLDGITLGHRGRMHATLVIGHELVRIDRHGSVRTLLTADDGLWNPASLAWGTGPRSGCLFVTNYAVLPPVPPANLGPALLAVDPHRRACHLA